MKLWQPSTKQIESASVTRFMRRLEDRLGEPFASYDDFYRWSVKHTDEFWAEVWDFCDIRSSRPYECVLADRQSMPGAQWFPGSRLNFAENLLRHDSGTALIFWGEDSVRREISFKELRRQVAWLAAVFARMGVTTGDRVAGLLPNIPEAIVCMLATASLGAVWSSCSPDFGVDGVVARFGQIEPKVLVTADGYVYKNTKIDLRPKVAEITAEIPSIASVIEVPFIGGTAKPADTAQVDWHGFESLLEATEPPPLTFVQVPFNHPLYVMYSSGTTGNPKCIVHSVGGTLIEHLKELVLHVDLKPSDRIIYATTCGWMMWNWLVSSLAVGATVCLYDGSPALRNMQVLFDMVDAEGVTIFGTSAAFISAVKKSGLRPCETHRLSSLRAILSTGSPLAPECFDFIYDHVKRDILLGSISGGTDIIGCFALSCPVLPVYRGELQTRSLGYAVDVFDDGGNSIRGEKGELVCTAPFPSMPIGFWNDPDGNRYHNAYFARYEGIWHHGDYVCLTEHDGMIVYGRSDAMLNPHGVRIGTAEIYQQLELVDEIESAVAVGQQWEDDTRVVLFVKLKPGHQLDAQLRSRINTLIRTNLSPRHLPAKIIQISDIPVTRSGKISELAVKNVIHGKTVTNQQALANPDSLECFANLPELTC